MNQDRIERALFFVWRREGKAVAFSSCAGHEGVLRDHYIGLDYQVALDRATGAIPRTAAPSAAKTTIRMGQTYPTPARRANRAIQGMLRTFPCFMNDPFIIIP